MKIGKNATDQHIESNTMDKERLWDELEKQMREDFERNLKKMKSAILQDSPKELIKKKPPIVHLKLVWFDTEHMLPLAVHEFDVFGTHEELIRLIDSKVEELAKSFRYRQSQNIIFNRLKDEYNYSDRVILDLLVPKEAPPEARDRVYKRLKQSRRRKAGAKRTTK